MPCIIVLLTNLHELLANVVSMQCLIDPWICHGAIETVVGSH